MLNSDIKDDRMIIRRPEKNAAIKMRVVLLDDERKTRAMTKSER